MLVHYRYYWHWHHEGNHVLSTQVHVVPMFGDGMSQLKMVDMIVQLSYHQILDHYGSVAPSLRTGSEYRRSKPYHLLS